MAFQVVKPIVLTQVQRAQVLVAQHSANPAPVRSTSPTPTATAFQGATAGGSGHPVKQAGATTTRAPVKQDPNPVPVYTPPTVTVTGNDLAGNKPITLPRVGELTRADRDNYVQQIQQDAITSYNEQVKEATASGMKVTESQDSFVAKVMNNPVTLQAVEDRSAVDAGMAKINQAIADRSAHKLFDYIWGGEVEGQATEGQRKIVQNLKWRAIDTKAVSRDDFDKTEQFWNSLNKLEKKAVAQTVGSTKTGWAARKEALLIGGETIVGMIPVVGTVYYWNEMSGPMKAVSVILDLSVVGSRFKGLAGTSRLATTGGDIHRAVRAAERVSATRVALSDATRALENAQEAALAVGKGGSTTVGRVLTGLRTRIEGSNGLRAQSLAAEMEFNTALSKLFTYDTTTLKLIGDRLGNPGFVKAARGLGEANSELIKAQKTLDTFVKNNPSKVELFYAEGRGNEYTQLLQRVTELKARADAALDNLGKVINVGKVGREVPEGLQGAISSSRQQLLNDFRASLRADTDATISRLKTQLRTTETSSARGAIQDTIRGMETRYDRLISEFEKALESGTAPYLREASVGTEQVKSGASRVVRSLSERRAIKRYWDSLAKADNLRSGLGRMSADDPGRLLLERELGQAEADVVGRTRDLLKHSSDLAAHPEEITRARQYLDKTLSKLDRAKSNAAKAGEDVESSKAVQAAQKDVRGAYAKLRSLTDIGNIDGIVRLFSEEFDRLAQKELLGAMGKTKENLQSMISRIQRGQSSARWRGIRWKGSSSTAAPLSNIWKKTGTKLAGMGKSEGKTTRELMDEFNEWWDDLQRSITEEGKSGGGARGGSGGGVGTIERVRSEVESELKSGLTAKEREALDRYLRERKTEGHAATEQATKKKGWGTKGALTEEEYRAREKQAATEKAEYEKQQAEELEKYRKSREEQRAVQGTETQRDEWQREAEQAESAGSEATEESRAAPKTYRESLRSAQRRVVPGVGRSTSGDVLTVGATPYKVITVGETRSKTGAEPLTISVPDVISKAVPDVATLIRDAARGATAAQGVTVTDTQMANAIQNALDRLSRTDIRGMTGAEAKSAINEAVRTELERATETSTGLVMGTAAKTGLGVKEKIESSRDDIGKPPIRLAAPLGSGSTKQTLKERYAGAIAWLQSPKFAGGLREFIIWRRPYTQKTVELVLAKNPPPGVILVPGARRPGETIQVVLGNPPEIRTLEMGIVDAIVRGTGPKKANIRYARRSGSADATIKGLKAVRIPTLGGMR